MRQPQGEQRRDDPLDRLRAQLPGLLATAIVTVVAGAASSELTLGVAAGPAGDVGATAPLALARSAPVPRGLSLNGPAAQRVSTIRAGVAGPTWVPVSELETTEEAEVAFPVSYLGDLGLDAGLQRVTVRGAAGLAVRSFLVRYVEGVEVERTILAEVVLRAPVAQVVVVGMRPRPAPPDIDEIIRSAATKWGADPTQLLRVAWCESRYDPAAYNAGSGASGLFQFMPATWARNAPRAGLVGASPFDAIAAADTAAMLFAQGQAAQWTCR